MICITQLHYSELKNLGVHWGVGDHIKKDLLNLLHLGWSSLT